MSDNDAVAKLVNFASELGFRDVTAFVASIPDSKSAIQIGGDDATVKFDISRTAPLFGERLHEQRPAVWTLDEWQQAKRPIIILALLTPALQAKMDLKEETPAPETKAADAEAPPAESETPAANDEWPSTMGAPVVHQHLHVMINRPDPVQGELAPALVRAIKAGEVRGLPPGTEVIDG